MTRIQQATFALDCWLRLAVSLRDAPASVREECARGILAARRERAEAVAEFAMARVAS